MREKLMNAFIKGRTNIHYRLSLDTPIADISGTFERMAALRAIAGLETAITSYNDVALRLHELSIAYACISDLQYATNRQMSFGDQMDLLEDFGDNFYNLSPSDIAAFKDLLESFY